MTTPLDVKVNHFLTQKRIAVAGVSRDNSRHPAANLIYRRLKKTGHEVFPVNPQMQFVASGCTNPSGRDRASRRKPSSTAVNGISASSLVAAR